MHAADPRPPVVPAAAFHTFQLQDTSLDESNVEAVGAELFRAAEEQPSAHLLLDFGKVGYLNSTGLAKLVGLYTRLRASGRRLALENVSPYVYEVFHVTRLTTVLDVRPARSPK
jgi:anti-anti-sigma factor